MNMQYTQNTRVVNPQRVSGIYRTGTRTKTTSSFVKAPQVQSYGNSSSTFRTVNRFGVGTTLVNQTTTNNGVTRVTNGNPAHYSSIKKSNYVSNGFGNGARVTEVSRNSRIIQGSQYVSGTNLDARVTTHTTVDNGIRTSHRGAYTGEGFLVSRIEGEKRVVAERELRKSHIIDIKQNEGKVVAERYGQTRIVNEYSRALAERVIQPDIIPQERVIRRSHHTPIDDEPEIIERIVEKEVEIIVEKIIPVERIVEVPYDVIVEKPIERIIEKEIEIEKVIEQVIEKTIEVPIEKILEIPIEEIIEKQVEQIRYVDVPVEKVMTRQVDDIHENIVYDDQVQEIDLRNLNQYRNYKILETEVRIQEREVIREVPVYKENIIRNIIDVPIQRIIEQPREMIIEKKVQHFVEKPVYIDNIIEQIVEVPVERIVEKPVEYITERPIYIDNIIRKPVPYEVEREVIQEVPVEYIVEEPVYRDNIIETIVEVPIRKEIIIEKEKIVDSPNYVNVSVPLNSVNARTNVLRVEKPHLVNTTKTTPIHYVIQRNRPTPRENIVSVQVPRFNETISTNVIKKEVVCEIIREEPVAIEKEVEIVIEKKIDNPIYEEVIEEIKVPYDQVINEEYEVLVPKYIDVEVEKEIRVPVKYHTDKPRENRVNLENEVLYNTKVIIPQKGGRTIEEDIEVNDEDLANRITNYRQNMSIFTEENRRMTGQISRFRGQMTTQGTSVQLNNIVRTNAELKAQLSELHSRLTVVQKDKDRLRGMAPGQNSQVIEYKAVNPELLRLRGQLNGLVNENKRLVSQAKVYH